MQMLDDLARGAFLGEVETQSIYALNALHRFRRSLEEFKAVSGQVTQARFELACEVFRDAHSALTHAGCLSRLLWPLPGKTAAHVRAHARAEEIRGLLDLEQPHAAVLGQRDLRNHLEHYDERLDGWAVAPPPRHYVHDVIEPFRRIWGSDDRDIMRWYDPTTDVYRFQGEEFELARLEAALGHALDRAQKALASYDPARALFGPRSAG